MADNDFDGPILCEDYVLLTYQVHQGFCTLFIREASSSLSYLEGGLLTFEVVGSSGLDDGLCYV